MAVIAAAAIAISISESLCLAPGDFDFSNALRVFTCLFIILSHLFYTMIDTNMYENQREVAVGYHGHQGIVVVVVVVVVVVGGGGISSC